MNLESFNAGTVTLRVSKAKNAPNSINNPAARPPHTLLHCHLYDSTNRNESQVPRDNVAHLRVSSPQQDSGLHRETTDTGLVNRVWVAVYFPALRPVVQYQVILLGDGGTSQTLMYLDQWNL